MKIDTTYMAALTMATVAMITSTITNADELTMMVEKDLSALGYDTGAVDGEETMETVIAISKFQAENKMEVTGEVTPQLAGALSAKSSNSARRAAPAAEAVVPAPAPASAPAQRDPAALQAAQQACLQAKVAAAQESRKKKRGLGRLMSAISRTAMQAGNSDVTRTANQVYNANATADDLSAAAKDLGLTEDDVAACQNPG